MSEKVAVVYVAGTGRSGSTLVGSVLGSSSGVVSIGEARHIWTRGLVENWRCGCGEYFDRCPFWTAVLAESSLRRHQIDLDRLRRSERELLRLRASVWTQQWVRNPKRLRPDHGYYLDAVEALYGAIARISGSRAIVDSSKNPTYGALLSTMRSLDLRVLHLVRDPRAAAYSWLNPKPSLDRAEGATMDRLGTAKSALLWLWWNRLAEELWPKDGPVPVLTIRYESLARELESILTGIRNRLLPELVGRPLAVNGDIACLGITHSVSGNPDRMRAGPVTVKPDERWRAGFAPHRQATVLAIAGLEMLKYGYRWGRR